MAMSESYYKSVKGSINKIFDELGVKENSPEDKLEYLVLNDFFKQVLVRDSWFPEDRQLWGRAVKYMHSMSKELFGQPQGERGRFRTFNFQGGNCAVILDKGLYDIIKADDGQSASYFEGWPPEMGKEDPLEFLYYCSLILKYVEEREVALIPEHLESETA